MLNLICSRLMASLGCLLGFALALSLAEAGQPDPNAEEKYFDFQGTYTSCSVLHDHWYQEMTVTGPWINGTMSEEGWLTSGVIQILSGHYSFASRWVLTSNSSRAPGVIWAKCTGIGSVFGLGPYRGTADCTITDATGSYAQFIGYNLPTEGYVSDLLCKPGWTQFWGRKTLR